MTEDQFVTATFRIPDQPVLLNVEISGRGRVTSNFATLNCPGPCSCSDVCSWTFIGGDEVSLKAIPESGWLFGNWDGDPECANASIKIRTEKTYRAIFREQPPLTVSVNGSGTVTSSPAGINCPGDCRELYASGTRVALSATPASRWQFASWDGACAGQGNPCTITIDVEKAASASFAPLPSTVALSLNQTNFQPQETHLLTLAVTPGGTPQAVDLYLVLELPDQSWLFGQPDGRLIPEAWPIVSNRTVAPFRGELLRYMFTGQEPLGQYRWLAGFTEPGRSTMIIGQIAEAPFEFMQ
jgi:hypothetical protein